MCYTTHVNVYLHTNAFLLIIETIKYQCYKFDRAPMRYCISVKGPVIFTEVDKFYDQVSL